MMSTYMQTVNTNNNSMAFLLLIKHTKKVITDMYFTTEVMAVFCPLPDSCTHKIFNAAKLLQIKFTKY